MKPLLFHSEATAELEAAIASYETQRPGLGQSLLAAVERAAGYIQAHPRIGSPYGESDYRHYVLRRFPYILFYLELPDVIWIAAVAHAKRRPGYWKHRSPEPAPPSDPEAA